MHFLFLLLFFVQEPQLVAPTAPAVTENWHFLDDNQYNDSVVKVSNYQIITPDLDMEVNSGSGVVFHTDEDYCYILTCFHVVSDGSKFLAFDSKNVSHKCHLIIVNKSSDLAVLAVKRHENLTKVLELSEVFPKASEKVECLGWGYSAQGKLRHWDIEVLPGSLVKEKLYIAGPFQAGDSGGAVLYKGKLVGIIHGGMCKYPSGGTECTGPGIAISLDVLRPIKYQTKMYQFPF